MASPISINLLSEKAIIKYGIILLLLFSNSMFRDVNGQGLEKIIVEKYYVADSSDAATAESACLPIGSVTYRVFVDMKPGYVLQSIYGDENHPMSIKTSTCFYNHQFFGNFFPNVIMEPFLINSTVMLDSWISVGAGGHLLFGVLKTDDDTTGTLGNDFGILQNTSTEAGIPLKERDGLQRIGTGGVKPGRVTVLNIDSLTDMLDKSTGTANGQTFVTDNGGWLCVDGAKGFDPQTNRVLIGQFTTSGIFSLELNIQIKQEGQQAEQYVTKNPTEKYQYTHPDLIYSSDTQSER